MTDRGTHIEHDGRPAVRFERTFRHPVERVWRAISDPAELPAWFPSKVEYEQRGRRARCRSPATRTPPVSRAAPCWPGTRPATWRSPGARTSCTSPSRRSTAAAASSWSTSSRTPASRAMERRRLARLPRRARRRWCGGEPNDGPHAEAATAWQPLYDGYVAAGFDHRAPLPDGSVTVRPWSSSSSSWRAQASDAGVDDDEVVAVELDEPGLGAGGLRGGDVVAGLADRDDVVGAAVHAPDRYVERDLPDRVVPVVGGAGRMAEERLDRAAAEAVAVRRAQVEHAGLGDHAGERDPLRLPALEPAARRGPGREVAAGGVAERDHGRRGPGRRRRPARRCRPRRRRRSRARRRRCRPGGTRGSRPPSRARPATPRAAGRATRRTPPSRSRRG